MFRLFFVVVENIIVFFDSGEPGFLQDAEL
jgi:hypothetical protein